MMERLKLYCRYYIKIKLIATIPGVGLAGGLANYPL